MTANDLTQAEIAGRIFKTAETCPVKGELIRDFELISTKGRKVSVSDYRGRLSLVLVFADGRPRSLEFLTGVTKAYREIQDEQAEVLAVLQGTAEKAARVKDRVRAKFPVLVDRDGRIHRLMGAQDRRGQPEMAVYVTDRFGEVFATFRESEKQAMPSVQQILGWLDFVNSQCPECSPPEWPM
ncbi:MAG TPA: redoxin domain-containing protein [Terriglobales bacterium]|nr:redoxin domain-containing protein [Terriglobales bacterium]